MLDKTPKQPSKFRTKDWVEINVHARGKCSTKTVIIGMHIFLLQEPLILSKEEQAQQQEQQI